MSEFAYIDWLRRQTPADQRVILGPGDDTALVQTSERTLVTTDMLLEGSCFRLDEAGPRRVGRKALAVNLSDIAAMGGRPTFAVVSVALPRSMSRSTAQEIYFGLRELAEEFGVAVVGGDTNSWTGPLAISVTLLGEPPARGGFLRCGAKVGDRILVTGPLGGSILGKHLDFTPRVAAAQQLAELVAVHAAIDISDGLAADLHHICHESRLGAVLNAADIPIADAARKMPDGRSPLSHALGDGEDFELILTLSPAEAQALVRQQPIPGVTLTDIGEIVPEGFWLADSDGRSPLTPQGYVHEFGDGDAHRD